jgi:hypothetical protein
MALELLGYDIKYSPRIAIMSQAFVDVVAEVDGGPNPDFGHRPRILDPVFRWVGHLWQNRLNYSGPSALMITMQLLLT